MLKLKMAQCNYICSTFIFFPPPLPCTIQILCCFLNSAFRPFQNRLEIPKQSAFSKPPRNSETIESVIRPPSKNVYPSPWRHHIELRENYLQVTQHVRDMYIDTSPGSRISLSSYLVQQGHVSHHALVRSCDCFLHAVNSHVLTRCAGGRLHRIEIIFKSYFL